MSAAERRRKEPTLRPGRRLDEQAVRTAYPLAGLAPGWFFRVEERAPGAWLAEGTDVWGRTVCDAGRDRERALAGCVAAARDVQRRLAEGR